MTGLRTYIENNNHNLHRAISKIKDEKLKKELEKRIISIGYQEK